MDAITFEHLAEPEIVMTRGGPTETTEPLMLASGALAKIAHAYDYGHNGEAAQEHERWTMVTYGVVAALEDPAEFYRHEGDDPAARRSARRDAQGGVCV